MSKDNNPYFDNTQYFFYYANAIGYSGEVLAYKSGVVEYIIDEQHRDPVDVYDDIYDDLEVEFREAGFNDVVIVDFHRV